MPQGVAHLGKLVEDHHGGILLQFPGLVENFLNIGLAAGGGDDLAGNGLEPVKTLLGHILGQNGHGLAGQQLGVESAAAAVVAGGGPYGVMICSIELTGHQAGSQAAEGSTHLVAAGGEPLTGHGNDAAGNTGQSAGNLHVIGHSLEQTALLLGLIVPGNTEQVHGIHIPQPGLGELGLDLLGDQVGVLHLGDGGNDDVVFLCLLDIMLQAGLVDGQIDHCLFSSCFLLLVGVNIRIQCIFVNTEVFCHFVTGFGHQERAALIKEADGPDLVILIHKGDGLAHQGNGLVNELIQHIVDIDDPLRLRLHLVIAGEDLVNGLLHHHHARHVVVDAQNGHHSALAVANIQRGGLEDLSLRGLGQIAQMIPRPGIMVEHLLQHHLRRSVANLSARHMAVYNINY